MVDLNSDVDSTQSQLHFASGFLKNDSEFIKLQAFVWRSDFFTFKSRTRSENHVLDLKMCQKVALLGTFSGRVRGFGAVANFKVTYLWDEMRLRKFKHHIDRRRIIPGIDCACLYRLIRKISMRKTSNVKCRLDELYSSPKVGYCAKELKSEGPVLQISPVWEPILSRYLKSILYVSYFFETFSFLFRKTRRKFLDRNGLNKRLRRSNPKSTEDSRF